MRLFVVLLFLAFSSTSFAIVLPSHSFFGANELYEESQDYINFSTGTRIGNINFALLKSNGTWGDGCLVQFNNDFAGCQKCCNDSWANAGYETDEPTLILFNNCMDACEKLNDAGPSLAPLGSTLWLLPFILGYAAVKRYKINKINK